MPNKIDVTGQRFGRLTVIGDGPRKKGRRSVICKCDCGTECVVDPRSLGTGHTTSCGCMQKEKVGKASTSRMQFHINASKMPENNIWQGMKQRCYNPSCKAYKSYGGRGINVCKPWRRSFAAFYKDMGPRPSPNHTIDRIDVNGNYTPENCRWATAYQQATNKRYHRWVTFKGEKLVLSEACRRAGVKYGPALHRLNKGEDWRLAPPTPLQDEQ